MKNRRTHPTQRFFAALFCGLWFMLGMSGIASAQSMFETGQLKIETAAGETHEFSIEIAATGPARQRGLMFRHNMPADHGMLFDYSRTARVAMWMKNTLIPLDMVFISADGRIESIAERTIPRSLDAISSRGRVRGVLELNGGTAARLGIAPGDIVRHAIFQTSE